MTDDKSKKGEVRQHEKDGNKQDVRATNGTQKPRGWFDADEYERLTVGSFDVDPSPERWAAVNRFVVDDPTAIDLVLPCLQWDAIYEIEEWRLQQEEQDEPEVHIDRFDAGWP